jgi:hypothetical protein
MSPTMTPVPEAQQQTTAPLLKPVEAMYACCR